MGFSFGQKNISPIAVDLGCDSIKLLQIQTEDPPKLVTAAAVDIPADARRDADAYRQFVVTALKDLLRQAKFKGKRAVVSLNAAHTYIQHVRLARGEQSQLDQQIETELRGRLPLDPMAMVIRHVAVGDVFADGANKQEIICLAASREWVMRIVSTIRAAGLDVVGIHCEPMAILAAFRHLFRRAGDEQRTTLFIDLGAATTKAIIAHGKQMVFAKTVHVGGDHFTRQLATQRGVGLSEARLIRVREAAEAPPQQPAGPGPGEVEAPARERRGAAVPAGFSILDTVAPKVEASQGAQAAGATAVAEPATTHEPNEMLETLIDELTLCVGYHAAMFADRPIEKVVFLGGESHQTAQCQRIAQALRLPAQIGDPLARLVRTPGAPPPTGVDLRQSQPGWAVPLGLCLLPTNL